MSTPPSDGRRLRSERSRQAVIDALLGLYDAGTVRPSVAQIAEASGVSERSVFRHFTDLEDLASAALDRKIAQVVPWFADPPEAEDRAGRVEALVAHRLELHDRIANLARAAAYHAVSSPTVARAVADRQGLLAAQVERCLAADLEPLPPVERARVLAALEVLLSVEGLEHLRRGPRPLDPAAQRAALVGAVLALLTPAAEEAR